ncbi:MAG TPA: hypothetical protein VLS93_13595 [Anaeromyxobacteraceae bacterium]|nr:hypothetical protein [Anaeromyxobacteraceae bacterium]
MALTGAVAMALALMAGGGEDRLLLCRPRILGDPALARGESIVEAGRALGGRFLDYGVPCEDAAEAGRAARRAGLGHGVSATAEGRTEGSRFVLTLAAARDEAELARRTVDVLPGADAAGPVKEALSQLAAAVPRARPERGRRLGPWLLVGAGAVALAAGGALAASASDAADRANAAANPAEYTAARAEWRSKRAWSAVALGAGGAAAAAGLTWRFAF